MPSHVPGAYKMVGAPGSGTIAFWVHSGTAVPSLPILETVSTTVMAVMRGVSVGSGCDQLRA